MFTNFDIADDLRAHIRTILGRLDEFDPDPARERTPIYMDLIACHNGGCPLDFAAMAEFEDFSQVGHDIAGISRHLDRETGKLKGFFHPRFALEETPRPGERVSYTTMTASGRGRLSFASREGTLIEIRGTNACVKSKNGREVWCETKSLRRIGQQPALTEAFLRMCAAFED